MKSSLFFSLVATCLLGCPKNVPTQSLSDDERMDQFAAQIEEFGAKAQSENLTCKDWCMLQTRMSEISKETCAIAQRNTSRDDFQGRCISSQEEVVKYQDQCARCGR